MLETIGYQAEMAAWAQAEDAAVGRVVRVDRGIATVLLESGPERASYSGAVLSRMAGAPEQTPCAGDWCQVRTWPDGRVSLEALLPRRTALVRATAGGQSHAQVLVANADVVAVVVSLHPVPVVSRIERLITLAWESGSTPMVILTKADLVDDADQVAEDVQAATPGVEVAVVSAVSGQGIVDLRERLAGGRTMALVGSSGHGKSSLVNALVGTNVLATKQIRDDGRGRHTSVRRELLVVPTGGAVVDTPGLRGIGLVDADEGLARTFADVEELVAECRFNDCGHDTEPGCAVQAAIADGSVSLRRFESWQRLQREMAWAATRHDARLRAERSKHGKRGARQASGRIRP